ncbi:hypothetical protein GCM10010497_46190 [Streptomyces cinereoruber]|uniref:Uncharacterized protein n=1 Tax=Streptomyces cinereoruber TaxID=67260 RepID=A0AAV4KPN8_9ACTN|nr:hypothetical protein [Streptomyces cinereoruber]MBB4160088.1 hypothetical protein [Streptomyces cinereoruber]MBY8818302.1 hypothetical protein [Streptomyces cinereoruber]NIH61026.1 hypothetical protein [Streptomyces cinereoruber]QEV33262.1 hypothetical protein CP977_14715 [Streptomyces cinereoruber]GGR38035.1 hypothetical protein GCM10010497_46190 [Streptomyces cinereoruber]
MTTGIPGLDSAAAIAAALVALGGAAALLYRWTRSLRQFRRRIGQFFDDWFGVEGRPGVPERPGVMQRLGSLEEKAADIKHEVRPNSGGSLRDAVDRVDARTKHLDKP